MRRHHGSGQPRSVCTDDNVDSVNELIFSQEGALKSHRTTSYFHKRQEFTTLHIQYRSSEFEVKCLKKRRAQELAVANSGCTWRVFCFSYI